MNPDEIETHHVWSRCVGRAFLMGKDPYTGQDFSHRRRWMSSLTEFLASVFAVDVGTDHYLSNHYHQTLRNRPDIAKRWSDEEVCWRWKLAWPQFEDGRWQRAPTDEEIEEMLRRGEQEPRYLPQLRRNLASISWFQARLKQKIAWLANRDGPQEKRGHYWEQRYGNRLLETPEEVLGSFVYNDLQQVAAGMADSIEDSRDSAIQRQIESFLALRAFEDAHGRPPNDTDTDGAEIEQLQALFANSHFAPISDDSPLITERDPNPPRSELVLPRGYSYEQRESQSDSEPDPEPATCPTSDTASPVGRGRPRRRRRRTRHQRLRRRQRRRASRSSLLGVPLEQYYVLLKEAERELRESRQETPPSTPRSQLPVGSAADDITPSTWRRELQRFTHWLRSTVSDSLDRLIAKLPPSSLGRAPPPNP
jgi:hypothetical protein